MVSALPSRCARVASHNLPKQGIGVLLLTLPLHWAVEGAYCSIVGVRTPEILSSPEPGAAAGLLLSQFPLRPITNATLEGKRKSKNHRFQTEITEAPPVADEARRFRGSVPIGGHEVAGNRLTRRWAQPGSNHKKSPPKRRALILIQHLRISTDGAPTG